MRYTEIAVPHPFDGPPVWHLPEVYGASPKRPVLYRLPVTGERPMHFRASLVAGLSMDADTGIITGAVLKAGDYTLSFTAENSRGRTSAALKLCVAEDAVLLTPLMGWCSWNARRYLVTAEDMIQAGNRLIETGLADYGYSYVNLDSAWQGAYGGEYDAIQPNERFPDMAGMCRTLHKMGFKCGIYSTPFINAFGLEECAFGLPGCTRGEPDARYPLSMGGIGTDRREQANARQWARWGFDYLKYDWTPCTPDNAELMKRALRETDRDFGFCVTVHALPEYADYWTTRCTSWRNNPDSAADWDNVRGIFTSVRFWLDRMTPGHFYDLDMLELGRMQIADCQLTEDEQLVAYSFRAFFNSPIQLSCDLSALSPFETAMFANEEIIAVNQNIYRPGAHCVSEASDEKGVLSALYEKPLNEKQTALAFFNLGENAVTLNYPLKGAAAVRDNWAKSELGRMNSVDFTLMPHTVRIVTVTV